MPYLLLGLVLALALVIYLAIRFGPGLLWRGAAVYLARRAGAGPATHRYTLARNVRVPMRDGVTLAADVYRPRGDGAFPTVLIRLPYGRQAIGALAGPLFARYGYAVVAQDTRGRYGSEGEFYPWVHEQEDGHDTTQWLAAQPWCNGRIGTWGASYFGYTQWALAPANPDADAMLPVFTSSDIYSVYYQGGAFLPLGALGWALENAGRRGRLVSRERKKRGLAALPLDKGPEAALEPVPFYNDWLRHPTPDDYWAAIDVTDRIPEITAPMTLIAGWYDIFLPAQLADWAALQTHGRPEVRRRSKLIVGPWNHGFANKHEKAYGIPHPRLPLPPTELIAGGLQWFDHALKGEANGWDERAPVRLYILGENVWRDEQAWPLARAVNTGYYLHSAGRANTAGGDGALSTAAPTSPEPADAYTYDPENPVPTTGGPNLDPAHAGPADQRAVEAREDVLVYSTEPLAGPLEVTGPVRLTLYAASDAPDTDFTAKLVDVFPDGRALVLCEGILRARYRDGLDRPAPLEPGRACRFEIDLTATAVLFGRGHRIRLEVSSSNFPRFNRNPNTGGDLATEVQVRPARQTVLHDAAHPSCLTLPVVPREG